MTALGAGHAAADTQVQPQSWSGYVSYVQGQISIAQSALTGYKDSVAAATSAANDARNYSDQAYTYATRCDKKHFQDMAELTASAQEGYTKAAASANEFRTGFQWGGQPVPGLDASVAQAQSYLGWMQQNVNPNSAGETGDLAGLTAQLNNLVAQQQAAEQAGAQALSDAAAVAGPGGYADRGLQAGTAYMQAHCVEGNGTGALVLPQPPDQYASNYAPLAPAYSSTPVIVVPITNGANSASRPGWPFSDAPSIVPSAKDLVSVGAASPGYGCTMYCSDTLPGGEGARSGQRADTPAIQSMGVQPNGWAAGSGGCLETPSFVPANLSVGGSCH